MLVRTLIKEPYKRNHEGDYHATEHEIRAMIRDQNPDGNDGMILEYYTMDDIDKETLRKYRQIFEIRNDGHVWNALDDKSFLEKTWWISQRQKRGKRRTDSGRAFNVWRWSGNPRQNLTLSLWNYRNESQVTADIRWNDRITYDGTWK